MAKVGVIMVDNMVVVGDIEIGDEEAHELFGIGREMSGPSDRGIGGHRFAPGGHPWSRHHGSRHRAHGSHDGDHEGRRGPRRGLGRHRDDDDDDDSHEGRDHGPPHDPARPLTHPRIKAREEAKAKEPEDEEAKGYGGAKKEEAEDPEAKGYGGAPEKKTEEESGTETKTETVVRGPAARRSKDRAHHRAELDNDEGAEQLARLTEGENPGEELAQLEAAGNRANARGRGSVREEMANPSYYPSSSRNRGARAEITTEKMDRARGAIKKYLGGSNLINYGTGNESPGSSNIRNAGTVTYTARPNEYYGVEPADIEWANRQRRLDKGAAEETERLPSSRGGSKKLELPPLISGQAEHRSRMPHPAPAPAPAPAGDQAGYRTAPSGEAPAAFIVHHTSGRGGPQAIVDEWSRTRPGVGSQWIMDREGNIHDVRREFGYGGTGHIHPDYTPESMKRRGIVNRQIVGMEIVAAGDWDVTPTQAANALRFIQQYYPTTPVYGHGEVNPGHREADEGMTVVRAIREERARAARSRPQTSSSAAPSERELLKRAEEFYDITPED